MSELQESIVELLNNPEGARQRLQTIMGKEQNKIIGRMNRDRQSSSAPVSSNNNNNNKENFVCDGASKFFKAIEMDDKKAIDKILGKSRSCLRVVDKIGRTALHIASSRGNANVVSALLKSAKEESEEFYGLFLEKKTDQGGMTALHYAAANGRDNVIGLLIAAHNSIRILADFNIEDSYGYTALHRAAVGGHLGAVISLIEVEANSALKNSAGKTPFYLACEHGHIDIVTYLYERKRRNFPLEADYNNVSVLSAASQRGHEKVVIFLLENGHRTASLIPEGTFTPESTLLHEVVAGGNIALLKKIIRLYLNNEKLRKALFFVRRTPLHVAAQYGRVGIIARLLKYRSKLGIDVNAKDNDGRTALHYAVLFHRDDALKKLLDCTEIRVNESDHAHRTPLHEAASGKENVELECIFSGFVSTVSILLEAEGIVVDCWDCKRRTPLHEAVYCGYIEIVKKLLEAGADKNLCDGDNKNPLRIASKNTAMCDLLNNAGANPSAYTIQGSEPIHWAARDGNVVEVVRIINGPRGYEKAFTPDALGHTAAHVAARYGQLEVVCALITRYPELADQIDHKSYSPLWWAVASGHHEVVEFLLNRHEVYRFHDNRHADWNIVDEDGCTIAHIAARNGDCELVRLLIRAGVPLNRKAKNGNVPLDEATNESVINLLQGYR